MTYEEALKTLDETFIGNLELKVVLSKALEKQIPKKPQVTKHKFRVSEDSYETIERHMTHCPYCFWEDDALKYFESLVDKGTKYCRRCGQALDWSDTE